MKAGFIGLGHLGRSMVGRLASQGVDLILWNRSPEKAADLGRELGLPVAESPAAQGKLTVLASGEKEAYQRGLPYLEKLAASISR